MKLSKRWLLDYVDLKADDADFADKITRSGSKVEIQLKEGNDLTNIVVGQITEIERHEDSDHLWVCKLNIGDSEDVQIVTGAQNLRKDDFVPVALNHSTVAGGKTITKGKLRGVMSCGMMCSLSELGLTVHDFPYAIEDGIFVLGDDCKKTVGLDIHEAIGLNDVITDFEITSNRPDCLSVIGLARETAATFDLPLNIKTPEVKSGIENVNDYLKVNIDVPDKCYRYVGGIVKNVRIKPSPLWMRERLRASGVRPINNIVDITNFVMLEYGQPMHAFDLRYVDGHKIIVRQAKPGEKITTLDDIERELNPEMTVIADENKAVAVAGVMGGEYSGIMDDTDTIVFESACFNGACVRRTSKALGLRTEASGRFEKELDPKACRLCLDRALELVQILDAGDVVNGAVDCDYSSKEPAVIDFDPDWVNSFIGIDCSAERQKQILEKLEFKVEDGKIIVPSFRNDCHHKADISEEIARFYGYDNIPDRKLSGLANAALTPMQSFTKMLDEAMRAYGLNEISTYSFISPKAYDKINLPKDSEKRNCVKILNPLGKDTSVMRTTAIPSMLDILAKNYNFRNESAALYEFAMTYTSRGLTELPIEKPYLIAGMYGSEYDFFSAKGVIEQLLAKCGITGCDVTAVKDDPTFHPGRFAHITKDGKLIAIVGEVHPSVCDNYGIETRAYIAQADVEDLFELRKTDLSYTHLPKFPAVTRDLAFVCDSDVPVLSLEKAVKDAVGAKLESINLFDVYQGTQIENGKKSVAFSLKLRSKEATLTDEECDSAMKKAVKAVSQLGAVLRS